MNILEQGSMLLAYEKMKRYDEQMKKNNGMLGFTSLYPLLDKHTSGIIPGKVYTIAGYSNVGKSRFAYGYINHFVKQGKNVMVFSLEVDRGLLFQHLSCNFYNKLRYELDINKIDITDFSSLYIYDDIYAMDKIEKAIYEAKPDFVFIDFVQNIQGQGSAEYEKMSNIARKIQEVAIKSNAGIFCLSQLSNTVGKDVSMGKTDFIALKGAGEFVASSDVIFVLRMYDKYLGVTIAKNKFGTKPGEIFFTPEREKSRFTIVQDPFINPNGYGNG